MIWGFLGLAGSTAAVILGCALAAVPIEAWGQYKKVQRERDRYIALFLDQVRENGELREQLASGQKAVTNTP